MYPKKVTDWCAPVINETPIFTVTAGSRRVVMSIITNTAKNLHVVFTLNYSNVSAVLLLHLPW
jgi:hypothetical protein